jgi:hypothetical protein
MKNVLSLFNRYKFIIGYVILVVAVIYSIGRVNDLSKNQLHNRITNVATWCTAINENREYDKTYNTKTIAMQAARSAAINLVLKEGNLTPQQTVFIKEYQALVINLINKSPGVLAINPYRLKPLDCKSIEARTASSAK